MTEKELINELKKTEEKIYNLELKKRNYKSSFIKTKEFKEFLIEIARYNPYDMLRTVFASLTDGAVQYESEDHYEFQFDIVLLKEILPDYIDAILEIDYYYLGILNDYGQSYTEAIFESVYIKDKNLSITIVDFGIKYDNDYYAYYNYPLNDNGIFIKKMIIELLKENGLEFFITNQEMNYLLYSNELLSEDTMIKLKHIYPDILKPEDIKSINDIPQDLDPMMLLNHLNQDAKDEKELIRER